MEHRSKLLALAIYKHMSLYYFGVKKKALCFALEDTLEEFLMCIDGIVKQKDWLVKCFFKKFFGRLYGIIQIDRNRSPI